MGKKSKGTPMAEQELRPVGRDAEPVANVQRHQSTLEQTLMDSSIQKTIQDRVNKKLKMQKRLQSHANSELVYVLCATLMAVSVGLFIVAWQYLYDGILSLSTDIFHDEGGIPLAVIPVFGGIVVVLLRLVMFDNLGMPLKVLNADLANGSNKLTWWRPPVKMIGAALTLGTGNSLGPEGPCVEFGGTMAILFASLLKPNAENLRPMFAAGCAAGLSAGFNAPVSAIMYGIEGVLKETKSSFSGVLLMLCACISCSLKRAFFGSAGKFLIPSYDLNGVADLPFFIVLGICGGVVSNFFHRTMVFCQNSYQWRFIGKIPGAFKPLTGALACCVFSFVFPEILFYSYGTTERLLEDVAPHTAGQFFYNVGVLIFKILCTCIAVSSGLIGGVFAPNIYTGALLGSTFSLGMELIGLAEALSMPQSPAFALVGMACLIAGACNCPYTSIILLFEMTRDYRIILPLIVAVGFTWWTNEKINETIAMIKGQLNAKKKLSLANADISLLKRLNVAHIMRPNPHIVSSKLPVSKLGKEMTDHKSLFCVVVDPLRNDAPIGVLTLEDVVKEIIKMETHLAVCFQMFDRDKSGSISFAELRQFLKDMEIQASEEEISDLIRFTDQNNDGQIQYEEFAMSADRLGIAVAKQQCGSLFPNPSPHAVAEEDNLLDVVNWMVEHNEGRLPVVKKQREDLEGDDDEDAGRVVGTLTFKDVLDACTVDGINSIVRERFF